MKLSATRIRIVMPTVEKIRTTGEMLGPTLVELTSFAGPLPLGPGDVLQIVHRPEGAVATGVETLKRQWIVELHARTPHVLDPTDEDWEAAELAADLMVDALAEFPHMMRTTRYSALVTSPSWRKVASFIEDHQVVAQWEVFRQKGITSLDWAATVRDSWHMDRPMYDRTGQRVD